MVDSRVTKTQKMLKQKIDSNRIDAAVPPQFNYRIEQWTNQEYEDLL